MALDLNLLGSKLQHYRDQFQVAIEEVSRDTGIPVASLQAYESGTKQPTGDEILILADYYKCDYKFFVSGERVAPFDQTEMLFRRYGNEFTKADRWAVQEFLFLCECEEYLAGSMLKGSPQEFAVTKRGTFYKGHGEQAARELRKHLGYSEREVGRDVFRDLRRIGIHVFRRKLANSNISGIFIEHPTAGKCVLINYSEDIYRQRFSAAHEAGHALLDDDEISVSFESERSSLSEVRANTFASRYLVPPEFLNHVPDKHEWNAEKAIRWANELRVNVQVLVYALKEAQLLADNLISTIEAVRIPLDVKIDPELPVTLSPKTRERRSMLLQLGLSSFYVDLCFQSYEQGLVTAGRLAEMLLTSENGLDEIADTYGRSTHRG